MVDRERSNLPLGEDEIDLYQSWLVIRKSWKLIVVLFIVFVAGAAIYSRQLPRVYRVNTIVSLGHVEIDGRATTLANLTDVTQMINSGSFLKKLIKSLNYDEKQYGPEFENAIVIDAKENSQNIMLRYDTADPPKAIAILDVLIRELQNTYQPRVTSYRDSINAKIANLKEDIRTTEFQSNKMLVQIDRFKAKIEEERSLAKVREKAFLAQRAGLMEQIKDRQEQLKELESIKTRQTNAIPEFERNTRNLLEGKEKLTTQPSGEGMITTLLLSNNMQQNIYLINELYDQIKKSDLDINKAKDSIHEVNLKAETLLQKIEENKIQSNMKISELQASVQGAKLEVDQSFPADIGKIKTEISQLDSQKATIEGIKVVTPPDYFAVSLKTKRNMLIGGSGAASLFVSVCLAFMINWSRENHKRIGQEHN
jgi:uncharacterized protein involved in exopolysaccharide biosynthesis